MRLTTYLDLLGLMLLVVGGAWGLYVVLYSIPLSLACAGLGVLAISWIIDLKGASK